MKRIFNLLFLAAIATFAFVAFPAAAQQRFDVPLACQDDVDLNTDETDSTVTLPNGTQYYVITGMYAFNASVTLSGSAAEIGLFSGATGAGEAIVTPTTMTGLTAATEFKTFTIAQDTLLAGSTLYIHTDDAHGTAATVDVCIYGRVIDGNSTIGL